jgi:hypothetical protein
MSGANAQLPPGFEALQPFADAWAVEGANSRLQRRLDSSEAERVAFFEAGKGLVAAGLEHLDKKPLGAFDAKEKRLMNLLLTFAHVAIAVEVQGDDEPKHAVGARRVTITRAPADFDA